MVCHVDETPQWLMGEVSYTRGHKRRHRRTHTTPVRGISHSGFGKHGKIFSNLFLARGKCKSFPPPRVPFASADVFAVPVRTKQSETRRVGKLGKVDRSGAMP